jgi:hypothetical protein
MSAHDENEKENVIRLEVRRIDESVRLDPAVRRSPSGHGTTRADLVDHPRCAARVLDVA